MSNHVALRVGSVGRWFSDASDGSRQSAGPSIHGDAGKAGAEPGISSVEKKKSAKWGGKVGRNHDGEAKALHYCSTANHTGCKPQSQMPKI